MAKRNGFLLNLRDWSLRIAMRKQTQAWIATAIAAWIVHNIIGANDPELQKTIEEHALTVVGSILGIVTAVTGWVDAKHLSDKNKGKV
jgi:hypothetical protein